jgi:hypothetical protein
MDPKELHTLLKGYYAGIGSRKTPRDILELITLIGVSLGKLGLTLRSGGAPGADSFFEQGCNQSSGKKEIYLPWKGFNKSESTLFAPSKKAFDIAKTIHPKWANCSPASKKLHARNIHQVLGKDLKTPVSFVLYWAETKNSEVQGGTATAVNLAKRMNIPSFNLLDKKIKKLWENITAKRLSNKLPQMS